MGPAGVLKALYFDQVPVRVPEEAVVDPVLRVMGRELFEFDASLPDLLVPAVHVVGDERYEDTGRISNRVPLAEADERGALRRVRLAGEDRAPLRGQHVHQVFVFGVSVPSCKPIRALITLKGDPGGYCANKPLSKSGLLIESL